MYSLLKSNTMFVSRVKRSNMLRRREYTYYVNDTVKSDLIDALHVNYFCNYVTYEMNVNKRLKRDLNVTAMNKVLSMCITVLGCEGPNLIPISISAGSIACTIEKDYFVICDQTDTNGDNKLIMFESHVITEKIRVVIDSCNSNTFIDSVNNFFNELNCDIKELTQICPIKGSHSSVILGCNDNSVYFKWSKDQTIEMVVDVDGGISIINIVNVKHIVTWGEYMLIGFLKCIIIFCVIASILCIIVVYVY